MADPRSTVPRGIRRLVDPRSALSWIVGGLLLLVQVAAWVYATPVFAGPDEPHHTFWAGAVVSGDLSGQEVADDPDRREVLVAPSIVALGYPCFAFQPERSAACEERGVPGDQPASVGTRAGRYPPLYYGLVGAPLLADAGAASVYAARLLTALVAVGLITWALWTLRDAWDPYLAVGAGLALTPMVLFTFAIINPSALEVAANLAVWLAGVGLVLTGGRTALGARTAVLGVAGAALALARPLSVIWLVLTVAILVLVASRRRLRRLFAERRTWGWMAAAGAATVAALTWLAWSGFVTTATTGSGGSVAFGAALRDSLLVSDDDILQLFGSFGWLDTPLASGATFAWLLLVGSLVMVALSTEHRRSAVALASMVAALVAVPVILQAAVLGTEGRIWQGRYSLPLAVGIPVVAAAIASRDHPFAHDRARRWLGWVLAVIWVVQVVAFTGTLRRYTVGIDGPYPGLAGAWQPPLGGWTLTITFAVSAAAFAAWMWGSAGRRREDRSRVALATS